MKKLSVVLAAAGLSASLGAYAAVPTDTTPFGVNIPNLKGGIEVTLEGLYLRPTDENLDYAQVNTTAFDFSGFPFNTSVVTDRDLKSVNPNYDFAFRIGLGYVFPDSGNDVQLNWLHFDHSNDSSTSTNPGDVLVTAIGIPLINPPVNIFGITGDVGATSDVDSKLDTVNLDVGQYVNFGTRLQTRFFGGLQFSRVEQDTHNTYSAFYTDNLIPPATFSFTEDDDLDSKFTGVGPRFGVDTSYNIWNCFGLAAHVSGALLVGKLNDTDQDTNLNAILSFPTGGGTTVLNFNDNIDTDTNDNDWRVVPTFDAKLGLNYTWLFQNQSALTLEAGYQVTRFFDVVDTYQVNNSGLGVLTGIDRETTNVGYDGPFLSLNYKM
ncbi:MAG: Lpg1974 family pore-forming outer membrane protein [Gammaproteobacteria bacterium]